MAVDYVEHKYVRFMGDLPYGLQIKEIQYNDTPWIWTNINLNYKGPVTIADRWETVDTKSERESTYWGLTAEPPKIQITNVPEGKIPVVWTSGYRRFERDVDCYSIQLLPWDVAALINPDFNDGGAIENGIVYKNPYKIDLSDLVQLLPLNKSKTVPNNNLEETFFQKYNTHREYNIPDIDARIKATALPFIWENDLKIAELQRENLKDKFMSFNATLKSDDTTSAHTFYVDLTENPNDYGYNLWSRFVQERPKRWNWFIRLKIQNHNAIPLTWTQDTQSKPIKIIFRINGIESSPWSCVIQETDSLWFILSKADIKNWIGYFLLSPSGTTNIVACSVPQFNWSNHLQQICSKVEFDAMKKWARTLYFVYNP